MVEEMAAMVMMEEAMMAAAMEEMRVSRRLLLNGI
jgi:hypothetical protein